MIRLLKRDVGKTFKVTWVDPETELRVKLDDFIHKGLGTVVTLGKLVYVSKDMIVLEHERCDDLGDFTKIHPSLVVKVSKG